MKPSPKKIIVKISEDDRQLIFEKPLVDINGRKFFAVTKIREEEGVDQYFAQGVSVGTVLAVGSLVDGIKEGDMVILDYIVDVEGANVISREGEDKIVTAGAVTTYIKEDLIIPGNQRRIHSSIMEKEGDLEEGAVVLAYVRNDVIYPVSPYVFMEYKEENVDEFYENSGSVIWSRSQNEPVVERKVLFVHEGCDINPGETVIIEEEAIFSRSLGNSRFDVAYAFDVIAIEV